MADSAGDNTACHGSGKSVRNDASPGSPTGTILAAGIAIVGALLGAAYPGLKAARQDAVEALAYE